MSTAAHQPFTSAARAAISNKRLSTAIQNLRAIREEGHCYTDKTDCAVNLAQGGKLHARGEPIHLIGVEFSKDSCNIVGFDLENT